MLNAPFQPPVKIVTFFNFTDADFTGVWDSIPYHFAAGEKMRMEDWKAKHFAKHLADAWCFAHDKQNRRKEQFFADIMAKAIIDNGSSIASNAGEVSKLQTELVGDDKVDYGVVKTEKELQKEVAKENGKEVEEEKKPFCSQCESKGVRHMKACPSLKTNALVA